ncbi:MAG TPA: hypothetical protein VLJ62_20675, partial [Burkholderiaceae bacterium]|nr:hypothetical protein [Burkholderiaceae bacterium]
MVGGGRIGREHRAHVRAVDRESPLNPTRWLPRVVAALGLAWACSAGAIDLQGHRGARGLAPENTLRAFEVALQQ